jgi:hypothetical protein
MSTYLNPVAVLTKKCFIKSLTFEYLLSLSCFPPDCCQKNQTNDASFIDNVFLIRLPEVFLGVHLIYNLNKIRYGQTNFDFGIRITGNPI